MRRWTWVFAITLVFLAAGAVGFGVRTLITDGVPQDTTRTAVEYVVDRDPDVPALPFDDNPDPSQCGIPVGWGSDSGAWLSGIWKGELVQPEVLVYDSHLRNSITGRAPHGTAVEIVLYQENPVLDYYFVSFEAEGHRQQGWVPEHFISFEPVVG